MSRGWGGGLGGLSGAAGGEDAGGVFGGGDSCGGVEWEGGLAVYLVWGFGGG